MTTIRLKKLELCTLPDDALILCVGKGATILLQDILCHKPHIQRGTTLSVPYDSEALKRVLRDQEELHKENHRRLPETRLDRRAYVVMDNIMCDTQWLQDAHIRGLFMQNRSYGLLVLMALQHMYAIPPVLRGCIDYLFLFADVKGRLSRLYDQFGSIFPSFDVFNAILDEHTRDGGCVVIHYRTPSTVLEDCVFWYRKN